MRGSINTATALLDAGNLSGAKREAERILGEEPENTEALSILARIHLRKEQPEEALAIAQQMLMIDGNDPYSLILYGRAYAQMGNTLVALDACTKAVEISPENPDTHFMLALYHEALGQNKKAEEKFRQALTLDPDNAEFLASYADFAYKTGRPMGEALQRAAMLDPENQQVQLLLGEVALDKSDYEEAADRALFILHQNRDEKQAISLLARARANKNPFLWIWLRWDRFWRSMTGPAKFACIASLILGFFLIRFVLMIFAPVWLHHLFVGASLFIVGLMAVGDSIIDIILSREKKQIDLKDDF
jgi:cytochrome c-type biogenesis protein CcmH/NrfG